MTDLRLRANGGRSTKVKAAGFRPPPWPRLGAAGPDEVVAAILLLQQRGVERRGKSGIVEPDGEVFPARGFGCFLPGTTYLRFIPREDAVCRSVGAGRVFVGQEGQCRVEGEGADFAGDFAVAIRESANRRCHLENS